MNEVGYAFQKEKRERNQIKESAKYYYIDKISDILIECKRNFYL